MEKEGQPRSETPEDNNMVARMPEGETPMSEAEFEAAASQTNPATAETISDTAKAELGKEWDKHVNDIRGGVVEKKPEGWQTTEHNN